MKLIAGLGNPGREYQHTPHNVGFEALELLCRRLNGEWRDSSRFAGRIARVLYGSVPLLLVQPQTFMNASGECVGAVARYFRVAPQAVSVVSDDVALPPGRLRIRFGGSDGGHRGLQSIIQHLATDGFTRLRIGVGRGEQPARGLVGHVLGRLPADEQERVDRVLPVAVEALLCLVRDGTAAAMNRYNGYLLEDERTTAAVPDPPPGRGATDEQGASGHVEKV